MPLTSDAFAPFGTVFPLDGRNDAAVAVSQGDGYLDARTLAPLIDSPGSLGYTTGPVLPAQITQMERHFDTQEGAFGAGKPFVLAVAAPSAQPPAPADVAAFTVPVGWAVVLERGVWHAACLGVDGPTPYYWFAYCANSGVSEWEPLAEPVEVRA
ncbi:MAG: ureidoglycolate lyase [Propionibacteriaceae bacterium]|nr:ureidoglycolate lyase [Propionibacteriaceae bacterium]